MQILHTKSIGRSINRRNKNKTSVKKSLASLEGIQLKAEFADIDDNIANGQFSIRKALLTMKLTISKSFKASSTNIMFLTSYGLISSELFTSELLMYSQ